MNVAIAFDDGNRDGTQGGAELAMIAFAKQRPEEVQITDAEQAEVLIIGNCTSFEPDLAESFEGRIIRFHHDLARHEDERLRQILEERAEHIFTSPLHVEQYEWEGDYKLIPPTPDLGRFKPNRQRRRQGKREGVVSVGAWQAPNKGGHLVSRVAMEQNLTIHAYGFGPYPPAGENIEFHGEIDPTNLPAVLWSYEQFVYLPFAPEPFGRCVAEAYAAECDVLTNDLVGAKWWIENKPEALFTANDDFWKILLD